MSWRDVPEKVWGFVEEMVNNPNDEDTRKIASDFLDECGLAEFAKHCRDGRPAPGELQDYDWEQAFGYAGGRQISLYSSTPCNHGTPSTAKPGDDTPCVVFDTGMVKAVYHSDPGANDGPSWLCVGELWDGRFFALKAGCDYTGWD